MNRSDNNMEVEEEQVNGTIENNEHEMIKAEDDASIAAAATSIHTNTRAIPIPHVGQPTLSIANGNNSMVNLEEENGDLSVEIHPTTGGCFKLDMRKWDTVDELKRKISRRIALSKDRICLLYRERDLREGKLCDNQVKDGSKITLLPTVETGLVSQKPEQTIMQALESLSDDQINTFLEGKAPLNLSMRLGDHMMFIQLQLSTVTGGSSRHRQLRQQADCPHRSSSSTSISSVNSSSPNAHARGTKSLAEASRNLSNTLQHLSSQALHKKSSSVITTSSSKEENDGNKDKVPVVYRRPGAVIDSMKSHGRGVYSGTFSGTLNPALQDSNGNPKRDISTIVHILNDLLGASPHYKKTKILNTANRNLASIASSLHQDPRINQKTHEEVRQLSEENMTTRGKMEQLKQLLQERRDRRKARRDARSPYFHSLQSARWLQPSPTMMLDNASSPVVESLHTTPSSVPTNEEYMKLQTEIII